MNHHKGQIEHDCTEKCKFTGHGDAISAIITKRDLTDEDICAYIRWKCSACGTVCDSVGRTALHVAASCGRTKVVQWLIQNKNALINAKDLESGYTPLHRSIFYGKIDTAIALTRLGANMGIFDYNSLSPLDHAMKDLNVNTSMSYRKIFENMDFGNFLVDDINTQLFQVYVWGTNSNYTLGTGTEDARHLPQLLDSTDNFWACVKRVYINTFHSVILTISGDAFSCGHGQGGRLGLNSEQTVLKPCCLNEVSVRFIDVSIAKNHSIFLTDHNLIMTCGWNFDHVLGITPVPQKILSPKVVPFPKNMQFTGVCAGRYHSVAYGKSFIYTWGLHRGQLGHNMSDNKSIITPKLLTITEATIQQVVVSDGATVIVTNQNLIIFHKFMWQKINYKKFLIREQQLCIKNIAAIGGYLYPIDNNDILAEKAGSELIIVLLCQSVLIIWQETFPNLTPCVVNLNRTLAIYDFALSRDKIFFVTEDGEAFEGKFRPRKKKEEKVQIERRSLFSDFLEKNECQIINVNRIANVHRAVYITCDPKGENFAVIQYVAFDTNINVDKCENICMSNDMLNLLNNAVQTDFIHDAVFKVKEHYFPVHKYIIASRSPFLYSRIQSSNNNEVEISNIHPVIFKEILQYIYSGNYDCFKNEKYKHIPFAEHCSPRQLFKQAVKLFDIQRVEYNDPCRDMHDVTNDVKSPVPFNHNLFKNLYDVVVKSRCGGQLGAHKCILAARLEYFNNLFSVRWSQDSSSNVVSIPTSFEVMQSLINYFYTNECLNWEDATEDFLCDLIIVSDQLFIPPIKDYCAIKLCKKLTLRNVAQFYQFGNNYNVEKLIYYCQLFICNNLPAVLESRILENLDDGILKNLTSFYSSNKFLSTRILTPYFDAPTDVEIQNIKNLYPLNIDVNDKDNYDQKILKVGIKRKSRLRKHSDSTINKTNDSISDDKSDFSFDFNKKFEEELKEKGTKNQWTKVLKENKTEKNAALTKNRLQAIVSVKEKIETKNISGNFTKLVSKLNESVSTINNKSLLQNSNKPEINYDMPRSLTLYDIPIQQTQKLSQKQRRKIANELDKINKNQSWSNVFLSKENNSFSDVLEGEINTDSSYSNESPRNPWRKLDEISSPVASPETKQNLKDIITDEKKMKENWTKMRSKPLNYIQMEDKAINELERFYNINEVSEEIITIHKVESGAMAVPLWVPSKQKIVFN